MPDKNLDFSYKNYLFQIKELLQFFIFVQICLFSGIKKMKMPTIAKEKESIISCHE
jgi:hypothetical protein